MNMRQLLGQLNDIHLRVWIVTLGLYGLGSFLVFVSFVLEMNGKNARIQNGLKNENINF